MGQRNFQGLADYTDKVHLGIVCLAMYAYFSVIIEKKKPPLCGLLKHVSRPLEQKAVLLDSQKVHFVLLYKSLGLFLFHIFIYLKNHFATSKETDPPYALQRKFSSIITVTSLDSHHYCLLLL